MNSGILLVDKPQGITSHDVVARTRRLAGTRRVGHAGTLDPMATGLLVLGVNGSTRLLTYLVGLDKEYVATIRLGAGSSTDDAEGELFDTASEDLVAAVDEARVAEGIAKLTGVIEQVPSAVSAIKVDGKRAYQRVRDGEQVELKARTVTISAFEVLEMRRVDGFVDLDVRVECSSGTYIRALARDLGADLGVGGHLTALRRTRIGRFSVAEASVLEELDVASALIGAADAAELALPVVHVTPQQAIDLGHGKRIDAAGAPETAKGAPIAAVADAADGGAARRLVAIVERRGETLKVVVGFPVEDAS
ncbi:tRNA pseudouridine(55) synthase TruB [Agromyces allii]|uniref:tRNA pseudouridine synthase B n=1 Tax=Agromyces allii TaxID=393607 RepID=A0ABN2Q5F3_9MICO|nr:tRNA pseudouridine(55) synthase TruB [Agromyces allii]